MLAWSLLAWQAMRQGPLTRLDAAVTAWWAAHASPAVLQALGHISWLADPPTLTVACVLLAACLAWQRHWGLMTGWVLALAGNGLLNEQIKDWIQRPRPPHATGYTIADGWSFPSGHSSSAMVAYGMLVYIAWQLWPGLGRRGRLLLALAGAVVIALVGISRVGLQVHYVSDVLAGWLSGSLWLLLCVAVVREWPAAQR